MIRRLRIKFICITMAILTVMMSLLLLSQFNFTHSGLAEINREALEAASWDYLDQQQGAGKPDRPDHEPPDQPVPGMPGKEKPDFSKPGAAHPCFILTLDSQGAVNAIQSAFYDLSDETVLMDIYQRAADREETSGVLWNYALRYLRCDSPAHPHIVFTDISAEMETLKEMARNTFIIWFLGFFGFLALSIILANWAIRPVEQAWEQQRQFVADASHELKTPLTVIMTNAELLREKAGSDEQRNFTDSILVMAHQMRDLVENMLQLARADSGQTAGERERLDYSALVEQILLPFEPLYFEAGLTLESDIRPGVTLTGNAAQLRRVVEILLDNAMKYAAPNGTVRVDLETRGSQCCLRVASPGQTLTARQCRDIFKRFYRVDPARRRNGSYGLGLSIAERVVTDHRGKIWAEGKNEVNTFYVNLPLN